MNLNKKGFTLVELLIVIGLLGAIALIVIAAINPIEQANRARDTRFRADSGQLISAIDRYFVAVSKFPWMTADPDLAVEDEFEFMNAADPSVGVCADATCSTGGTLITNNELKSEFMNRDFIKDGSSGSPTASELILIGKAEESSSSIYACFIPLSKSEKQKACDGDKAWTIAGSVKTVVADCDPDVWDPAWYICVPE